MRELRNLERRLARLERKASTPVRKAADKVLKAMEEMERELEKMPSFKGTDPYYQELADEWYFLSTHVEEKIKHIAKAY